ncbi:MAG: DUF1178 family protein [Erythrobacter sp.]
MIVFDLHCGRGHRFEGWFGSTGDYEQQLDRGLVSCPECGSGEIGKALMAPAVAAKGNTRHSAPQSLRDDTPMQGGEPAPGKSESLANHVVPAELHQAMQKLAEAQAKALKNSTWVGSDFAKASREMHYGDREEAPIHGKASLQEAKELAEEGVPLAPLPFPVADPEELN